jgi:hypothetical protein
MIEQIVEDCIDKIWLPFEFKFIEWEAEYKAKYLLNIPDLKVFEYNGYKVHYVPNPLFEEQPMAESIPIRVKYERI